MHIKGLEHVQPSESVREELQGRNLLAFSRGKDALAAWIAMMESGHDVVPFHMTTVPGLDFIEESLAYYERKMGTKIIQVPHNSLARHISGLLFQPPGRLAICESTPMFEKGPWEREWVAEALEAKYDTDWLATGVRAADSPQRYTHVKIRGPINENTGTFLPVWDWGAEELEWSFKRHDIKLPVDYQLWGRTFDGLDARFMLPLRDRFPKDYQKVLEWFPLLEADIFRHEVVMGKGGL